jgi:hypothetical protein
MKIWLIIAAASLVGALIGWLVFDVVAGGRQ